MAGASRTGEEIIAKKTIIKTGVVAVTEEEKSRDDHGRRGKGTSAVIADDRISNESTVTVAGRSMLATVLVMWSTEERNKDGLENLVKISYLRE